MSESKKCALCAADAVAFCACQDPATFLCSLCAPLHGAEHSDSQLLPMKAFGHHAAPGYVEKLRDRVRLKEMGEDELMGNLKAIGDCQKEFSALIAQMTKSLSTYLSQNITKLQRLKVELENDIDAAVTEVEAAIYEESPQLSLPLARALWAYSPGSLRLFKFEVKQRAQLDLSGVMRYSYSRVESIPELTFAQDSLSVLDQQLSQEGEEQLVISDDEEVEGEECAETLVNPADLLSEEANRVHMTLQPLRMKQVAGVQTAAARLLPDGRSIYVGDWLVRPSGKCLRHGFGRLYSADGSLAEGYWRANFMHIAGRVVYPNGDYYEGEFAHGMREGIGKMQTADPKTSFYGKWSMDKRNGYGHELSIDGTVYEGHYINDEKTGEGKFLYRNGNTYTGAVVNGLFDGKGVFQWADGRMYDGEWQENLMHGKGKFTYTDGSTYEGEYLKDRKEGYGVYKWQGKVYEGTWKAGQMHGKGWMTLANGIRSLYEFDMGKAVSEVS